MLNQFKKSNIFKYKIFLLISLISIIQAQEISKNQYSLVLATNTSNLWWSTYNQGGLKASEFKFTYQGNYENKKINFHINLSAIDDGLYIGESFFKASISKDKYFKAGKYYRDFSTYLDDDLSSGSMLISHNAEPMPKIGFFSSHSFKNNTKINLGISHASFRKNDIYNKAPMLHEKFLYLNYLKNNNEFQIGFVHVAMWGGSTEQLGALPSSFKDFLKVIISADGPLLDGEPHANALGNHLGVWDFYYKKNIDERSIKLYYQHLFEDTSGLRFANGLDGLWGMQLSNNIKDRHILFEYINTINQDSNPPYVEEAYYNHYQYTDGWSYKKYTLGNPFISHIEPNPSEVVHFGIKGKFSNIHSYSAKLSKLISKNDFIKYKLSLKRAINNKSALQFSFINNKESNGLEVSFFAII